MNKWSSTMTRTAYSHVSMRRFCAISGILGSLLVMTAGAAFGISADDEEACLYKKDVAACSRLVSDPALSREDRAKFLTRRGDHRRLRGEFSDAISDYGEALKLNGKESDALFGRALTNQVTQNWIEAIVDLNAVIAADPKNAEAIFNLGNAYAGLRQMDRAITTLSAAIAFDAAEPEYRIGRGAACLIEGDVDGAIIDFSAAIGLNPKSAESFVYRAKASMARGDTDRAIADFGHAIRLKSDRADFHLDRAALLRSKGSTDEALADYNRAIEIDPASARGFLERGVLRASMKDQNAAIRDLASAIRLESGNAAIYSVRAVIHAANGAFDSAIADQSKAIALLPSDMSLYEMRAWTRFKAGKFAEALVDADRAAKQAGERPSALSIRGHVYEALGRKSDAIGDFKRALAADPGFRDAHAALVRLGEQPPALPAQGAEVVVDSKPLQERVWLTTRITEQPSTAQLRAPQKSVHIRSGPAFTFPVIAVVAADKAMRAISATKYLEKSGCGIDTESAQLIWYKFKFADGEGYVSEFGVIDPSRADPARQRVSGGLDATLTATDMASYEVRAGSFGGVGALDQALPNYARAIELEPNLVKDIPKFAAVFADRGQAFLDIDDQERAIANFTLAIAIDAKSADAFSGRARGYWKAGKNSVALADVQQSLRLRPENAATINLRGHLHETMGRRAEAIADFRSALKLDPAFPESKAGLARLGATP